MPLKRVKLLVASIFFAVLTKFVRGQLKPMVNPQTNVNTGVKPSQGAEDSVPSLDVRLPFQLGVLRGGVVLLPRENAQVWNPVRSRNGSSWREVVDPSVPVETPVVERGTRFFNSRDSRRMACHAHYVAGNVSEVLPDGRGGWRGRVHTQVPRRGWRSHTHDDLFGRRCRARADDRAGSV